MDSYAKIREVESKYRLILDLSQLQLACLEGGRYEELPDIIHRKAVVVDEAGVIMTELRSAPDESVRAAVNAELQKLAQLVAAVMRIEDRCQGFLPSQAPLTSKSRAASLYRKAK